MQLRQDMRPNKQTIHKSNYTTTKKAPVLHLPPTQLGHDMDYTVQAATELKSQYCSKQLTNPYQSLLLPPTPQLRKSTHNKQPVHESIEYN